MVAFESGYDHLHLLTQPNHFAPKVVYKSDDSVKDLGTISSGSYPRHKSSFLTDQLNCNSAEVFGSYLPILLCMVTGSSRHKHRTKHCNLRSRTPLHLMSNS